MDREIKLENVKKIAETKFLKMFELVYNVDGRKVFYSVATRNEQNELVAVTNTKTAGVVRVAPYIKKDGQTFAIVTKEFRFPINEYVYSTPAGNIDRGETPEQATKRELLEEIGATAKRITQLGAPVYPSVGLTDELVACFAVEVDEFTKPRLEENEIITYELVAMDDLLQFTNKNVVDMQAKLVLNTLAYEWELKKHSKNNLDIYL